MKLLPADEAFVQKREGRSKYWPFFGSVLLAVVVAYGAWLWFEVPHLINPWHVFGQLEAGALPESTISVMAAMLPVIMLTLLVFVFLSVLLWFIPFANERRLTRLIRKLEEKARSDQINS